MATASSHSKATPARCTSRSDTVSVSDAPTGGGFPASSAVGGIGNAASEENEVSEGNAHSEGNSSSALIALSTRTLSGSSANISSLTASHKEQSLGSCWERGSDTRVF